MQAVFNINCHVSCYKKVCHLTTPTQVSLVEATLVAKVTLRSKRCIKSIGQQSAFYLKSLAHCMRSEHNELTLLPAIEGAFKKLWDSSQVNASTT